MPLGRNQGVVWRCILLCVFVFTFFSYVAADCGPNHYAAPGVAFSLTPDYGTAAIAFENGTFATIGPIEGNSGYKEFMRRIQQLPAKTHAWCDAPYKSQGLLQRLLCPRSPDVTAARHLLKSLKHSVESRLGTTFCFANLALPHPKGQEYQRNVTEEALSSLGLTQVAPALNAASMTTLANIRAKSPLSGPGPDDQLVLAVDHSKYGFNVALIMMEDDIVYHIRQQSNFEVSTGSTGDRRRKLKSIIADITKPPFSTSDLQEPLPDKVQRLVIYGDGAEDPGLGVSLTETLGKDIIENSWRFEPLFAGAIAAAESNRDVISAPCTPMRPSAWCGYWSKLYDNPHFEL